MRIENVHRMINPSLYSSASTVAVLPKLETGSVPEIQEHI